jgi:integrase
MSKMYRGRLTDSYIEGLRQTGVYRDGALPGFLVRCGKRLKTFEIRTVRKGRPHVFMTLGHWPMITAQEGRLKAVEILTRYERRDPIEGMPTPFGDMTINEAWKSFQECQHGMKIARSTFKGYELCLARLSSEIRAMPMRKLGANPMLMVNEIDAICKRLHNSPNPRSAGVRTARFVSTLFKFLQKRDYTIVGDPVSGIGNYVPNRQKLHPIPPDELPKWWKTLQKIQREHHREAHLFCLLSGLRRGSLESLKWKDVNLRRRCIHIASPKGGPDHAFDLILSRAMLRCLWRARRISRRLFPEDASRWVFAGHTGGHISGHALTKDGLSASNHDLRRTYATFARASGVARDSIARLLNHKGEPHRDGSLPS